MDGFTGNGMSGAGWVVMSLLVLLFCALAIGGIVWAIRRARRRDRPTMMPGERSAARVFTARFTRGNINDCRVPTTSRPDSPHNDAGDASPGKAKISSQDRSLVNDKYSVSLSPTSQLSDLRL